MAKTNATAGNPIVTLWGIPPVDHPIRNHPMVRWMCRTKEDSDPTGLQPIDPMEVPGGSSYNPQRIATRIVEHMQDQIALGADPSSLSFFIQNHGYWTSETAKTEGTPVLFQAPDDAVTQMGSDNTQHSLYCGKAVAGTLTVEDTLTPIKDSFADILGRMKTLLQNLSINPPGMFTDDLEGQQQIGRWLDPAGGIWDSIVADARAGTEDIVKQTYRIDGVSGTDMNLNEWITDEETMSGQSFTPDNDVDWRSGSNAAIAYKMLQLRNESNACYYAACTQEVFGADSYWDDIVISNYSMLGSDIHRVYPGAAENLAPHITRFHHGGAHAPMIYPFNTQDGTDEEGDPIYVPNTNYNIFVPGFTFDPGKTYSYRQIIGEAVNKLYGITRGSSGSLPIHPWIKGVSSVTNFSSPTLTPYDMYRLIMFLRGYPTVTNILVHFNDTSPEIPDWDGMLWAINKAYS